MKRIGWLISLIMVLSLLAACGPTPEPQVIKETVVVETEKEVVVTKEVEKEVVVTKEVEKQVTVIAEPPPAPDEKQGGTLVVALNNAGVGSLDPLTARHTKALLYGKHLFDPLARIDPATGAAAAALAESWETSPDGLSITYNLRDDVMFHDGTPFNAEAVKFNFDRIQELGAEGRLWTCIGKDAFVGAEVVDEFTVKLNWTEPQGEWWECQAYRIGIQSPTAVEQAGEDYGVTTVVGTGAYKLVEWVEDDHIAMERNPDYQWGSPVYKIQGPPYLEQLLIKGIRETGTRLAALEAGEVDVIDGRGLEFMVSDVSARRGLKVEPVPKAGTTRMVQLNTGRPPFDDIRVRQAFSHAIDRQALLLTPRYSGVGKVAYISIAGHNWPGGEIEQFKEFNYLYDPEKAMALLDEAGWVDTDGDGIREKDGQKLSAEFVIPDDFLSELEPVQAMVADVGIEMVFQIVDDQTWFNAREEHLLDGTIESSSGWGLAVGIERFRCDSANNTAQLCDPELDALIDELAQTTELEKRKELAAQALQIILSSAAVVPTVDQMYPWMMKSDVIDVFMPVDSWARYYDVWLDREDK